MFPLLAFPLSLLIRWCYGGLVHISLREALPDVWRLLSDGAMVEVYSFCADLLDDVRRHVRRRRWMSRIGRVIGKDVGYVCLGTDGSHHPAPVWFSHGPECPAALVSAIKAFSPVDHED